MDSPLSNALPELVPSLFEPFRPHPFLFNGHLQTLYGSLANFDAVDRVQYHRVHLRLVDGGTLGLDFAPADPAACPENAPIIVVTHGLTGGSQESYVRAILARACAPGEEFRAVVVNFRGCQCRSPITGPHFYTAGHTDDLRAALVYLTYVYPRAAFLGLGFSMGANVMTRYLAEEGAQSRLSSACVLSCPWDLEKNVQRINSTFLGRNLYSRGMGRNLVDLLRHHAPSFLKYPTHALTLALSPVLALRFPTFSTFDDLFTRRVGGPPPLFPMSLVGYYRWASSHRALADVCVPFLAINADDDPVVAEVPLVNDSKWIAVKLTRGGGHLGWFAKGGERWTTRPVLEWLEAMRTVKSRPAAPVYRDNRGFVVEAGRDDAGILELEEPNINEILACA